VTACAHHLPSFCIFDELFPDNPEPVRPDPKAWTEVDPGAEDQAFLVEQADEL